MIECSLPPWLPTYASGWVLVVSVSVPRTDAVLAAAGREAGAALRRRPQGDAPHLHRAHQRGYVLARGGNEISRNEIFAEGTY